MNVEEVHLAVLGVQKFVDEDVDGVFLINCVLNSTSVGNIAESKPV